MVSRRRVQVVGATGANALAALAPQGAAVLLLGVQDFGKFSFVYLVYALGISLSLSLITEPWHAGVRRGASAGTRGLMLASATLGILLGAVSAVLGWLVGLAPLNAALAGLAIGLTVFRGNNRYVLMQRGRYRFAAWSDVVFLVGLLMPLSALLFAPETDVTFLLYLGWAAGSGVSCMFLPQADGNWMTPWRWVSFHGKDIRRLLADSVVMDVGATVPPMFLLPILGLAGFGVYRAVSNVMAPVRLILNPLRPLMLDRPSKLSKPGGSWWTAACLAGLAMGALAGIALWAIAYWSVPIDVLAALGPYALPVGLTVWAGFIARFTFMRARADFPLGRLMAGRIWHTVTGALLPILGGLAGGLAGAIWAAAVAGVLAAVWWAWLDRPSAGGQCVEGEGQAPA